MQLLLFDEENNENYSRRVKQYGGETEEIQRHLTMGLLNDTLFTLFVMYYFVLFIVVSITLFTRVVYVLISATGRAIFSPILIQLTQNLQEMLKK